MLSINFSTPLAGAARSERIKQMTRNHPAFEQARASQEILVKVQTSLRRMPGVSAKESNEIVSQLQEVGQIVSQEVSQLVDALMNLQLDQEDTDKAIARMSIEANLAKAEVEDRTQGLNVLRGQLSDEKEKRRAAEAEVAKVVEDLQKISQEFRWFKEKGERGEGDKSPSRSEIVKHLEDTIQHLEGQVNNRRSLWVMKHSSPESVARAIETMAESCGDKEAVHKTIMSMRPEKRGGDAESQDDDKTSKSLSHVFTDMALQPSSRTSGASSSGPFGAPPRFGPLTNSPGSGTGFGLPPRAPSVAPPGQGRCSPSPWNAAPPSGSRFGPSPGNANALGFSRAPSRRGFHGNGSTFRPDWYNPAAAASLSPTDKQQQVPFRPETALGHRPGYYPATPSTTTRSKYSRFRDPITSPDHHLSASSGGGAGFGGGGGLLGAPGPGPSRPGFSSIPSGPPIHLTEMTVSAWNEQIMDLYGTIRRFVDGSACEPIPTMPTDLSTTRLWPVLIATYYPLNEPEAISYLDHHLKEVSSKSCLVTRVIVDFIVNRVWVPRAWSGADTETSSGLVELAKQMDHTLGQPSSYRQPLLDRQAAIIDAILKLDHFPDFSKDRVAQIAEMLLSMLRPLFNESASDPTAYRDLEAVARTAWALSSRILCSRLTFDFRFPEVGARFSCQSMVPVWPPVEPAELQARHWRVALVTTPVITCRNDTGSNISAHSVALADVICMQ